MKKNDAFDNSFELLNQGKPLPPGKRLIVSGGEGVEYEVKNTPEIEDRNTRMADLKEQIEILKHWVGQARAVASFWRTVAGIEFLLIVGGILALLGRG